LGAHDPVTVWIKTKPELALDMIGRAKADGIPGDIVLADSGYGDDQVANALVAARHERRTRAR
jgi:SRSO17 transposase